MNIKAIFHSVGRLLWVEAILMIIPLIVSFIYKEATYWSFIIPIAGLALIGLLLFLIKPTNKNIYAKEGFAIVGLSWIFLSLFGCLPFVISKQIPSFINAFFETVSGFTTTGASILNDVESLSHSMLFWRSFTHWIGGMGVLVFVLAILPSSDGNNIFILRAESTGPKVGKLVSKVKVTARILYLIYIAMTIVQVAFLLCGEMNLFESLVHSFATAGTGGFAIKNSGLQEYSVYSQMIITLFMFLFGVNFNIFYLIIIGKITQALISEELWWYIGFIVISTLLITLNIFPLYDNLQLTFKDALFQVTSIITSTGFATTDFNLWPNLSKALLFFLMFVGACAGSTGGGVKVSRIAILFKSIKREIKKLVHPNSVTNIKFEKTTVEETVVKGVANYFIIIIVIFAAGLLIVSFDSFGDFETNSTAMATCLNNIGPGFGKVGPMSNFSEYNWVSKLTLIFSMLIGRLEIYPILIIFNPKVWLNK